MDAEDTDAQSSAEADFHWTHIHVAHTGGTIAPDWPTNVSAHQR